MILAFFIFLISSCYPQTVVDHGFFLEIFPEQEQNLLVIEKDKATKNPEQKIPITQKNQTPQKTDDNSTKNTLSTPQTYAVSVSVAALFPATQLKIITDEIEKNTKTLKQIHLTMQKLQKPKPPENTQPVQNHWTLNQKLFPGFSEHQPHFANKEVFFEKYPENFDEKALLPASNSKELQKSEQTENTKPFHLQKIKNKIRKLKGSGIKSLDPSPLQTQPVSIEEISKTHYDMRQKEIETRPHNSLLQKVSRILGYLQR